MQFILVFLPKNAQGQTDRQTLAHPHNAFLHLCSSGDQSVKDSHQDKYKLIQSVQGQAFTKGTVVLLFVPHSLAFEFTPLHFVEIFLILQLS